MLNRSTYTDCAKFPHSRESAAYVSIPRNPYLLLLPLVGFHPPKMGESIAVGITVERTEIHSAYPNRCCKLRSVYILKREMLT